jgi:type II secretory pathway predicted ATPase ExeA
MLAQYFGFQEEPFGAAPDPRWLYRSAQYREALASLRHGFQSNRGFSTLIASPGLGKTTLLYQFLHDIRDSARIVFLFDTQSGPLGLLRYILRDLGITPAINGDEMHVQLEDVLVKEARAGRVVVVVVDEAQNLSDEALEMLRLLTNYETPRAKLVHIVLSGQPALAKTLTKPSMEQLRQRVTASCWLEPLSIEQTTAYIRHRVEQAGYRGAPLFRKDALNRILLASHGVPRIINNLCFNALSLCREKKLKQVDGKMAAEAIAIQELDPEVRKKITDRWTVGSEQAFQPAPAFLPERPIRSEAPVQIEQPRKTEPAIQPERLPTIEEPLRVAQPARAQKPRQTEPAIPMELPPEFEEPLQAAPQVRAEAPRRTEPAIPMELPPEFEEPLQAAPQIRAEAPRRIEPTIEPELQLEIEERLHAAQPVRAEELRQTEPAIQPELPPKIEEPLQAEESARTEDLLQIEPAMQSELPPETENLFELADLDEAVGRRPVWKVVKLTVAAAAVLLIASLIAQFTLPARWRPWSRLADSMQSSGQKTQSVSDTPTSEANVSAENAGAPPKPSPLKTYSLRAVIPVPASANMGQVTTTEPSARTKASPAELLSPPSSAPPRANADRVEVAGTPSKTTSLASTVAPPSIPAPAAVNTSRIPIAEPVSKAKSFQITVEPNQTLREICVRYLGIWDLKRLHEIQVLNPQLTDLDHLLVGQKIWLPAPEPAPLAQPSTPQGNSSPAPGAVPNAKLTPPSIAPAIRNPGGGARDSTGTGNGAPSGLIAKKRTNVAPAGLPTVTGTARAGSYGKVAPVPADMLPPALPSNPAEESTPNCGGINEIPCPKLRVRTSEDPN